MRLQRGLELIGELVKALFEAEERRIDKAIEDLDRSNREVKGHQKHGFMFQGRVFVAKNAPYQRSDAGTVSLAFELHKKGNFLVKDIRTVDDDKKMIEQITYLLIQDCGSIQDLRDALPESMVNLSDELMKYPRLNQEGYTLSGNERAVRQFNKLKDKIDFYTATRLIY